LLKRRAFALAGFLPSAFTASWRSDENLFRLFLGFPRSFGFGEDRGRT